MPGAGFKRQAAVWHKWVMDMTIVPYAAVKKDLVRGISVTDSELPLIVCSTGTRHSTRVRCVHLGQCTG